MPVKLQGCERQRNEGSMISSSRVVGLRWACAGVAAELSRRCTYLLLLASQAVGEDGQLLAHGGGRRGLPMRPRQHGHIGRALRQACDGLSHLHRGENARGRRQPCADQQSTAPQRRHNAAQG